MLGVSEADDGLGFFLAGQVIRHITKGVWKTCDLLANCTENRLHANCNPLKLSMVATHAVVPNPLNASILIGMRDGVSGEFNLVPRDEARVSVFDSAFMLGDGIWEGIRAKRGVVQFARDHLNRLFESSKAMCEFKGTGLILFVLPWSGRLLVWCC